MPRRNYPKPEVRKRITRQRALLSYQLEVLARELKAWQEKTERRQYIKR